MSEYGATTENLVVYICFFKDDKIVNYDGEIGLREN
jgi:hypothetical protein